MNGNSKHIGVRIAALVVVVAVLLIGGVSMTRAAAQTAIPGDALYPVKTTIEQTRLSLAQDAGDRAQMKMGFAELRLDEIAALIDEGRYHLVNEAVLSFEADINSAILELATIAQVDPARAARIALEITAALTRYAQTLSVMAASAPEGVQSEVARALDTTKIAAGLQLPAAGVGVDDNSNGNENEANGEDGNANSNGDDGSSNSNDSAIGNDNGDAGNDNSNANGNLNGNANDDDGGANGNDVGNDVNGNDDNSNGNANGGASNDNGNGDDDNGNDGNSNSNDSAIGNDNGGASNDNANGGDDNGNDDGGDDSSGSGNGNNSGGGDDNDNGDD
jgi:uncharacterized membrane protein YgcG